MDDALLVGIRHRPRELRDHFRCLLNRLRLAIDPLRKAAAIDELQRKIGQSLMLADLVNLDDIRLLKMGDRFRLGLAYALRCLGSTLLHVKEAVTRFMG